MEEIETIPDDLGKRLEIVVEKAWNIFTSYFLNKKYEIEREAPFQFHFASILKLVGELYCLKREETFFVDLESKIKVIDENKYIDIVCGFIIGKKEYKALIELKFKTLKQSAEDLGAMEIYKDIYDLENVIKQEHHFQTAYFFMITDNPRYTKAPRKNSLRAVFNTSDNYEIQPSYEYKYTDTKTGDKFYKKNGSLIFKEKRQFKWQRYKNKFYFLKMKI